MSYVNPKVEKHPNDRVWMWDHDFTHHAEPVHPDPRFPRHLYKDGEHCVVQNFAELSDKRADGWQLEP